MPIAVCYWIAKVQHGIARCGIYIYIYMHMVTMTITRENNHCSNDILYQLYNMYTLIQHEQALALTSTTFRQRQHTAPSIFKMRDCWFVNHYSSKVLTSLLFRSSSGTCMVSLHKSRSGNTSGSTKGDWSFIILFGKFVWLFCLGLLLSLLMLSGVINWSLLDSY